MPRKRRLLPWLDTIGDVYYAFWYNAEKRRTDRQSLGTADPATAATAFALFLNDRSRIISSEGVRLPTCGEALTHYWNEHVMHAVMDRVRTESKIKHLRKHFDALPIASVSIQTSRDYVDARRTGTIGRPAGDGTIRTELTTMTAALNHEAKWGRIERGAVPFIEKPSAPPPRERWLTQDELKKVFDAVKDGPLPLRGFVNLAYYTAGRRRSIETLTWFQWPEGSKRISLNPQGRRQTNKRRPVVPVHPVLVALRKELWDAYGGTGYVLGSQSPMWYGFHTLCDRLGLKDVVPHTLRHSRATHLLQQGVEPWAVANLLGDTLATVLRVYGHHCPDYLAGAIADDDLTAEELLK